MAFPSLTFVSKITQVTTAWFQAVNDIVGGLADTADAAKNDALIGNKRTATGAVATTLHEWHEAQAFNAKAEFGAVGDWNGTIGTDNAAAINAALTACALAGGGVVRIGPGNFYCSTLVGSDPNSPSSWHENVQLIGDGAGNTTLTFANTYAGTCVCLNGNNVAVRNLTVRGNRTIDHHAALGPQRVIYQLGIWVGSKNNIGTVSDYRSGAEVTGCEVLDMNLPIVSNMAGRVWIDKNTIDRFTDTGIIIDNPSTDVWITRNKITNGGDDHIFARHYATSAWAVAGNYSGRVFILYNICNDTFGKNIGIGGLGDVRIAWNYCGLSWAGGINFEKDDWYKTNALNYRNLVIENNTIVDAGRNFNTSEAVVAHQSAAPGENPSGIHSVYQNTDTAVNWTNVTLSNNKIYNPYQDAIALSASDWVTITTNTFTAGSTNHGAGAVSTQGAGVYADSSTSLRISGSVFQESLGIQFVSCYSFANGTGFSDAVIQGCAEKSSSVTMAFSDATAKAQTQFIRASDDEYSADRGDANVTIVAGVDKYNQRFATALTVNRTITLSSTGAVKGDKFKVVRTGGGAFTLAVGALKTIPAATAAVVEVIFDGSAWQIDGYQLL